DFDEVQHVIDTNITGTIYLLHLVARQMKQRGQGRILITGSIAGFQPGSFQAVYNATKAFIDSFSFALRNELKDTGVTVSCLMPGLTETNFFARADMLDTKLGADDNKSDPVLVAKAGFEAMMKGEGDVATSTAEGPHSPGGGVTVAMPQPTGAASSSSPPVRGPMRSSLAKW
ncbi:MAG: SDR family NAD(P)-dependent oxidoreductase, partial [Variovorax sp.]